MGSVAKHIFLVTDPDKLEATVRTAFEIARTGRPGPGGHRHPEGRAELAGRVQGLGRAADAGLPQAPRDSDYRHHRRHRGQPLLRDAGRIAASADLRRRRRHQRQRVGGAARVRARLRHPGGHHADGHRRRGHHRRAVDAHARHARRGVRQLRGRRLRLPHRHRRAFRRSRRRQPGEIRAERQGTSRTSTSTAPRSTRSSACSGATWACCPRRLRTLTAHGQRMGFARDRSKWLAYLADLQAEIRDELRPRQRS